jgi:hypothetical protein
VAIREKEMADEVLRVTEKLKSMEHEKRLHHFILLTVNVVTSAHLSPSNCLILFVYLH